MRRVLFCVAAAVLAVASLPSAQQGDKVKAASDFLGAENMKSVRYTGFGANYTVGQAFSPTDAWPKVTIKSGTGTGEVSLSSGTVTLTDGKRLFAGSSLDNETPAAK